MKILPSNPAERRRQLLLLGVLVVAAGLTWWFLRSPETPVTATEANGVADRAQPAGPLPVPEAVKLGVLDDVAVLADAGRNPFAFGVRPAPPPPQIVAPPPGPMNLPQVPVAPPPPSGPPPIALRLAGMATLTAGGRVTVTLKDPATNAVFLAHEGDIVDGRYKIVKVGATSVIVSYVDGTGSRTLNLGG